MHPLGRFPSCIRSTFGHTNRYNMRPLLRSISDDNLKSYRLQGSTSNTSKSGVYMKTNTNHMLQSDVPIEMGGKNEAPQPVEMLLGSLIGCTQATALFVGRQMKPDRIIVDKMEFDLKAIRDERGALSLPIECNPEIPSRLLQITGSIVVHAAKAKVISDYAMQKLKGQTERRCPVANMISASGCEINVEWIDGSKTSK
jgi:uncharacterized OsmC-like protein